MSSGMLSAAASLGMILLWDVDGGLTQIDKYLYSSEDYIKVYSYFGCVKGDSSYFSSYPDQCFFLTFVMHLQHVFII